MGQETLCQCTWAGESAACKVLLESNELILRGPLRKRAPLSSLTEFAVDGDALTFRAGEEKVALLLGAKQAQSWAKKLTAPPVTLAAKLGIRAQAKILLIGEAEPEALAEALREAAETASRTPEQIVACVHDAGELQHVVSRATAFAAAPPVWIVYRKGPRSELSETAVRQAMRAAGFMDTKVAAVDAAYTALRFNRRA